MSTPEGSTAKGRTACVIGAGFGGMALAMRNLKQDLREAGEIKGYNPGFTPKDRSAFLQELDRTVRRALKTTEIKE